MPNYDVKVTTEESEYVMPDCTCTFFPCGLHHIPPRSPEEVRAIARDAAMGHIFIAQSENEADWSFGLVLDMTVARYGVERFRAAAFLFEYVSKAGPTGINGKPFFTSMRIMHVFNVEQFWRDYDHFRKVLELDEG